MSVALTPGEGSWPLSIVPSACVTIADGMTTLVVSVASSPMPRMPVVLLATMTPSAPAACALSTLVLNEQVPRSTSAILPDTPAPVPVQPLIGDDSAMSPVRSNAEGPNCAPALWSAPASVTGKLMMTVNACAALKIYMRIRGRLPSDGVDMFALLRPL